MTIAPPAIFDFSAISTARDFLHGKRKTGRVFDENFKLIEDEKPAPAPQPPCLTQEQRKREKLRQAGILVEDDGSQTWVYGGGIYLRDAINEEDILKLIKHCASYYITRPGDSYEASRKLAEDTTATSIFVDISTHNASQENYSLVDPILKGCF